MPGFKIKALSIILTLLVILISLLLVSKYYKPKSLFARFLLWNFADANDYKKFPYIEIHRDSSSVFNFKKGSTALPVRQIEYTSKGKAGEKPIDEFLKSTDTTSFIVIKDDNILYENYYNGHTRDSLNMSFSMGKSFISALVGIAISEGYIKDVNQSITDFIPELRDKEYENITIKHLLTMSSGAKFKWWDGVKGYYSPNIKQLITNLDLEDKPGQYFHYKHYDPQLLGLVLERATHIPASQYLEEKIWKPLGMEYNAIWSIDSNEDRFEKMEGGISGRAIDFAKLGRLYLKNGNWDGKQIIPEQWIKESTSEEKHDNSDYYTRYNKDSFSFAQYYRYLWWGLTFEDSSYDFFIEGSFGQVLYISPSKNAIVVRMGTNTGKVDSWPRVIYENIIKKL